MPALVEHEEHFELDRFLGHFIHSATDRSLPVNQTLLNVTQFKRERWWKDSWLRFFDYPEKEAVFAFISEENDNHNQVPYLYIRPPTESYTNDDFREAVRQVMEELRVSLEKHGRLLVDTSAAIRDEFTAAATDLGFTVKKVIDVRAFYMNNEQLEELKKTKLILPEGFEFTNIDLETEVRLIHESWSQGHATSIEALRARIRDLPSVGVREVVTKKLVTWEFMSPCVGKFNHLHCDPAYRGHGLGLLTELRLAQTCAEKGLRVYKNVQAANESVINGTSKHSLWTTWKNDEGKPIQWTVTYYDYMNMQSNDML